MARRTRCARWLGLFLGLIGCARSDEGPRYDERCLLRVQFRPDVTLARTDLKLTRQDVEHPELIGSWDGFARPGPRRFDEQFSLQGTRYFSLTLPLAPGRYRYGFLVGNELLLDDLNPHSEFGEHPLWSDSNPYEAEWSITDLTDCRLATLSVAQLATEDSSSLDAKDGRLRVEFRLIPGVVEAKLASLSAQVLYNGQPLADEIPTVSQPTDDQAVVELQHLPSGKYQVALRAKDAVAGRSLAATAHAVISPRRMPGQTWLRSDEDRQDTVLYHVLIDRFRGPSGALRAPSQPGRRAGGTLGGVASAIESGYFESLGVTTLWLSPLYQNAPGLQRGRDGNYYESYHGYWPTEPRSVEPKLGSPQELSALSQLAHRHGLRVIFDAVPNHVFSGHPYYRDHGRASPASQPDPLRTSWFSDGLTACVCGTTGCGWGERIEDCWFDSFLPDVNLRNPEAAHQQRDDLLWWLQRFDLDGMRIDAVPMMPRGFTRQVVQAVTEQATRGGLDLLIVGENYTGPGDGGRFEIRSFLGDRFFGLHSAFDFPLFWATVDALAKDRIALSDLEQQVALSEKVYGGSGAVMAHIVNNHDTARFVSEAAGNAGNDPWNAPPPQPTDREPYQRHMLALTLLLTLPGMPVLYYGDEVGLAGGGDPDSRRVLPDVMLGGLPSDQREVLLHTQRLGQLRRCLPALRRGVRAVLQAGRDYSIALHTRSGDKDVAISVLSRTQGERLVQVSGIPTGRYRDVLSGETLEVRGTEPAGITLRALRSAVFVSEGSSCR